MSSATQGARQLGGDRIAFVDSDDYFARPGAMWALAIVTRYVVRRPFPGLNRIPGAMLAIAILARARTHKS